MTNNYYNLILTITRNETFQTVHHTFQVFK